MNNKRREILLGYLLGALEKHEEAKIELELQTNISLQNDLAQLYEEVSPIMNIVDNVLPPKGLANRTCHNLWEKIDVQKTDVVESSAVKIDGKVVFGDKNHSYLAQAFHTSSGKKRRTVVTFTQDVSSNEESPLKTTSAIAVSESKTLLEALGEPSRSTTSCLSDDAKVIPPGLSHSSFLNQDSQTTQNSDGEIVSEVQNIIQPGVQKFEGMSLDEPIPLSMALEMVDEGSVGVPRPISKKMALVPSKEMERQAVERKEPKIPKPHLLLSEPQSLIIKKNHPKHYGSKSQKDKQGKEKNQWRTKDIVASLLVGIALAVVIYPLVHYSKNAVYNMIYQQRLQTITQNMPAQSYNYSAYGMSPNDLMLLNGVSLDSGNAGQLVESVNKFSDAFVPLQQKDSMLRVSQQQEALNQVSGNISSTALMPVNNKYPIAQMPLMIWLNQNNINTGLLHTPLVFHTSMSESEEALLLLLRRYQPAVQQTSVQANHLLDATAPPGTVFEQKLWEGHRLPLSPHLSDQNDFYYYWHNQEY